MIRWAALWCFAWPAAAMACDGQHPFAETTTLDAANVAISLKEIHLARPFSLTVEICDPAPVQGVIVDANMPAHKHGMNYRPDVVAIGDQQFQASGMLFHMPGQWELQINVDYAGRIVTYTYPVELR